MTGVQTCALPIFEFQTLRQGWKPQDDVQYYVFKASKLKQLLPDTLSMGRTHLLNMEILCMDKILNYDRNSYLQKIGNHILRQTVLKHHSPFNLLMAVQPVSLGAGKMVRFRMIEVFNKKGIYNKYFLQDNLPYLLDRFYYEVPFGQFVSFFRMVPVYDALIANPQTFMEYYKRGVVFYDRGNFRAAIADFEKAKSLSALNDVFLVHSYLGNSYFELEIGRAHV